MLKDYLPIILLTGLSLVTAMAITVVSRLFGSRKAADAKVLPYECGVTEPDTTPRRVSIRFYIVALLFIIFDLEVAFLFPWASVYRRLGLFGFWQMMVFAGILFAGFVYAWRLGAFEWE